MALYNASRDLENAYSRLESLPIPAENKKAIRSYVKFKKINGRKPLRLRKLLSVLSGMAVEWGERPFKDADREDIVELIDAYMERELSPNTLKDYLLIFRDFFRYLGKADVVDWIKPQNSYTYKTSEHVLTREEVEAMCRAAHHPRDRAFISMLYETGARASEICNLRVGDVEMTAYGAVVHLGRRENAKTGPRDVIIFSSAVDLALWLSLHPSPDDPESPLWCALPTSNSEGRMTHTAFRKIITTAAREAGIRKRVHLHLFRHSRATELAEVLNEVELCDFFGWVYGSNMPRIYIHRSKEALQKKLLQLHGVEEIEQPKSIKIERCPRCNTLFGVGDRFCRRCGLGVGEPAEFQMVKQAKEEAITALDGNPEAMRMLLKVLSEGASNSKWSAAAGIRTRVRVRLPGFEPGLEAWEAPVMTPRPQPLYAKRYATLDLPRG